MRFTTPSPAMWRDAVLVAALAVVTVQALRRWCGDRYLVPTGSMEPVLHGDPQHGDVVFVAKLAGAAARRRHDLVVVAHPNEPGQQMVKRIAARGDDDDACFLDIRQGDVWLGPDPQRMRREQKDPLAARGQRVPWAMAPGTAASRGAIDFGDATASPDGTAWTLRPPWTSAADARTAFTPAARAARRAAGGRLLPAGSVGTARPVDAGFLDATGARSPTGADVAVSDAGIELALARLTGELLATIETRAEALTFHWQPSTGRVVLWRDGEDVAAATLSPAPAARRLEFGLLDDRAFFCVDGAPEQLFVVARRAEWNPEPASLPAGARTLVHAAALGGDGAAVEVTALRVFHDVFAWREPIVGMPGQGGAWPRFVAPGHWFLLGDSAFDSHDSRQFGPVPMESFLGVPCCVLGPWPRTRWVLP